MSGLILWNDTLQDSFNCKVRIREMNARTVLSRNFPCEKFNAKLREWIKGITYFPFAPILAALE